MPQPQDFPYATYLDVKFAPLSVVDVPSLVAACKERWYNQTLCKVNDSVIRLGVMQGEYHWHKHDADDEFFFVLEGHFIIDLACPVYHSLGNDEPFERPQLEGFVVPKGVVHRTREIDDEVSLEHEEELVVSIVLVPVVFTLHHAKANDGVVHLAQGLVVPALLAGCDQRGHVDHTQRRELDVEVRGVREILRLGHASRLPAPVTARGSRRASRFSEKSAPVCRPPWSTRAGGSSRPWRHRAPPASDTSAVVANPAQGACGRDRPREGSRGSRTAAASRSVECA